MPPATGAQGVYLQEKMQFRENTPLAPYTTFGIGGPARWFAEARSEADVSSAARFARDQGLLLFPLGGGSNLLVADGGFAGLVLRVAIDGIDEEDLPDERVLFRVGAGVDWDALVTRTVGANCAGIECLAGIPGSTGGTPVQNVGAYGQEVAQTIACVRGFDLQTSAWCEWRPEECGFAYRTSRFNTVDRGRFVLTRVDFALTKGGAPTLSYADLQRHFAGRAHPPTLSEVADAVREIRRGKGMVLTPGDPDTQSAGSFFKNPVVSSGLFERLAAQFAPARVPHYPAPDHPEGGAQVKLPAAWLLEQAGFVRGYTKGRAGISTRHTLALTNRGGASAAEIFALRDEIIRGVQQRFGVHLDPEPVLLGS